MTTALQLLPTEERACLNITIRDDGVDEREERFFVVIQTVPPGVIASQQRTTVTILSRLPPPEPGNVYRNHSDQLYQNQCCGTQQVARNSRSRIA